MFIENIGIPLPTEIGYLIAKEIITLGLHSYLTVLLILTLGHVVGSTVSYTIGILSDRLLFMKLSKSDKLEKTDAKLKKWFEKYGTITIFITRFVGYVRPWSSFVAGLGKVRFWPFLFWTALGSLIFNIFCLYFSGLILIIWRHYGNLHLYIVAVVFLCFFGFIIYAALHRIFFSRKKK
jgi:membrane protein DedA with SNARE-associated domain